MSLARATVSGTIVTEIEKRYTPNNTPVSNFTIMVNPAASTNSNSNRMDQPSPVRITCWRGLAEQSATQLRRGDNVVIEGRLQIAQLDNQTVGGYAKKQFEVDASAIFRGRVDALGAPNVNLSGAGAPANPYGSAPAPVSGLSASVNTTQQQTAAQPIQTAPAAAPMGTVTFDDDITEDDIPF